MDFVAHEIKPKTELARAIYAKMCELGTSIDELSRATHVGYERARTAVTGDEPPSKRLLDDICRVLRLDGTAMRDMLITEQVKRKYGRIPASLTANDAELRNIEELWQFLTGEEKEHVSWLVARYVERRVTKQHGSAIPRIGPRNIR